MEFLQNIPDILYKYRVWTDPYHKRILTDNEIYLASPDQFNDPFDATLPFRFREKDLTPENILLKLRTLGREMWPEISEDELNEKCVERQRSGIFDNPQYWKDDHEKFKDEINKTYGILSLTSKNNNLLMWSHYSDSHKGFCVGLDKFSIFKTIWGTLGSVIYSDRFPDVGLFDQNGEGIFRILTTKSKEWEYEDEYRITRDGASRQVFEMSNDALKEVVLGFKMPDTIKAEIANVIRRRFPHVNILESKMNSENFKLDMFPYNPK